MSERPPSDVRDRAWERAQRAWPGIGLAREAFRAAAPHSPESSVEAHAEDLYLACACAAGVPSALAAFEQKFVPEMEAFLARVERNPSVVAEVRQLVRTRLFVAEGDKPARIAEYAAIGRLASWLRVVTLRVHKNLLRGARAHAPLDDDEAAPFVVAPELALLRDRHRADLEAALRAAFLGLAPRERTLLRFHYLDGLTLEKLAAMYGAHRATVARWLAAARERVVEGAAAELRTRIGIADEELASWLGLLRSGVELSLGGLLRSDAC